MFTLEVGLDRSTSLVVDTSAYEFTQDVGVLEEHTLTMNPVFEYTGVMEK